MLKNNKISVAIYVASLWGKDVFFLSIGKHEVKMLITIKLDNVKANNKVQEMCIIMSIILILIKSSHRLC